MKVAEVSKRRRIFLNLVLKFNRGIILYTKNGKFMHDAHKRIIFIFVQLCFSLSASIHSLLYPRFVSPSNINAYHHQTPMDRHMKNL